MIDTVSEYLGIQMIEPLPLKTRLHDGFLLPIEYLDKSNVHLLSKSVCEDLELLQSRDASGSESVYQHLCDASNAFSNLVLHDIHRQYTSNVEYLKNTQDVIDRIPEYMESQKETPPVDPARFQEIWSEIKEDAHFLERHSYMEWSVLEHLNHSTVFLQFYSLMNIISPLFSVLMPFFFLVLPFLILQLKGVEISFSQYAETLKEIAKSHFIGKAMSLENFSVETMLYFLFTAGLYFLQTYQNVHACIRYYDTVRRMNENLCDLNTYLNATIKHMSGFVDMHYELPHYAEFCQDVHSHRLVLEEMAMKIGPLSRFCCYDWTKWTSLGKMLHVYYELHSSIDYEESLRYSVGFEGYLGVLIRLSDAYESGRVGKCDFLEEGEDTVFVNQSYFAHGKDGVKNTCNLDKNLLITGINASGKTTLLKTAAINVILSQQFGFGFYETAHLVPYQHVHSYINIPDTSGRDSLFQAESRRCKEILDKIKDTPTERHFCIFDELYSGTNPREAAKSAYSLLRYLSKKECVRFMLTTHYVSVCKRFVQEEKQGDAEEPESTVANYQMDVEVEESGEFRYTYVLNPGICTLEGGLSILKNMDYPEEILETIHQSDE